MSIVDRLYTLVKRGMEGKNVGLPTGFDRLDKYTYGIQRRHLATIGGDTGSGKSTLALWLYVYKPLTAMIEKGEDVNILYFSFEMSSEVLFAKLLSLYIYDQFDFIMSYEEILSLTRPLSEEGYYYLDCSKSWLKSVEDRISIVDRPLTAGQIGEVLEQWVGKFGNLDVRDEYTIKFKPKNPMQYLIVAIDHVGLLEGRNVKSEIDEAVKIMMTYRNSCNITGCFVQQLNRNFKSMDRKNSAYNMVQLNDFADSSGPSHGSELVLAIFDAYREKESKCLGYDIKLLKDRFRAIIVLKNRFGISGKAVGLNFFGEIGYWRELPPISEAKPISNYTPYLFPKGSRLSDSANSTDTQSTETE